jgi:hypothetical protein
MKKFRNWLIGDYLSRTTNVFERAKTELLFNFTVFYLINLLLFEGNLISNHFYYHAYIITFAIGMLIVILIFFKLNKPFLMIARVLFWQQVITGIISYLIQKSSMDFVGEFWILVNILITFFTMGKRAGFIMSAIWALQLVHCLINDSTHGKFILIDIPNDQVLPPAPGFIVVPFCLCIYIIYQFVNTRSIAENDIQEQKKLIEDKNKEIIDSITYAKRIQRSLLPTTKYFSKHLDDAKEQK